MRSMDPKGRLMAMGGDTRWQRRIVQLAEEAGLVLEIMSWDEASSIESPVSGIVVHVAARDGVLDVFRAWAARGLQPVCVVSLESSPGAAELKAELAELGFERILHDRPQPREEGRYWSDLKTNVTRLASPNLALVPGIVDILGRSDIGLVRLVAAALDPPVMSTVERWRSKLGVSRRELSAMLEDLGLPAPKPTLDLLRLALAVHLGTLGLRTRDQIAGATSFGSGDYLGKRCGQLTGRSFGQLVQMRSGVAQVLRRLEVA